MTDEKKRRQSKRKLSERDRKHQSASKHVKLSDKFVETNLSPEGRVSSVKHSVRPSTQIGARQGDHTSAYKLIKGYIETLILEMPAHIAIRMLIIGAEVLFGSNRTQEFADFIKGEAGMLPPSITSKEITELQQSSMSDTSKTIVMENLLYAEQSKLASILNLAISKKVAIYNKSLFSSFFREGNIPPPTNESELIGKAFKRLLVKKRVITFMEETNAKRITATPHTFLTQVALLGTLQAKALLDIMGKIKIESHELLPKNLSTTIKKLNTQFFKNKFSVDVKTKLSKLTQNDLKNLYFLFLNTLSSAPLHILRLDKTDYDEISLDMLHLLWYPKIPTTALVSNDPENPKRLKIINDKRYPKSTKFRSNDLNELADVITKHVLLITRIFDLDEHVTPLLESFVFLMLGCTEIRIGKEKVKVNWGLKTEVIDDILVNVRQKIKALQPDENSGSFSQNSSTLHSPHSDPGGGPTHPEPDTLEALMSIDNVPDLQNLFKNDPGSRSDSLYIPEGGYADILKNLKDEYNSERGKDNPVSSLSK